MIRNLLLGALAAIVVVGGYIGSVYWRASTDPYADVWANQKAYIAEQVANDTKWNALEAQDTYGGATPEETWAMYIDALKKGDVELAARYFQVDKQEKMLNFLTRAKESSKLEYLLSSFTLAQKGEYSADKTRYTFLVNEQENAPSFSFELVRNPQTNIWKIYEL